jgi:hypothetical protein
VDFDDAAAESDFLVVSAEHPAKNQVRKDKGQYR